MRKTISLVLILLLTITQVCFAEVEVFSIRNGIIYGDTMTDVESKESLGIAERTDTTLTTETGTIASVSDSFIVYSFNSDGILCDVLMDFGVHIGKPEQASSAYETVKKALTSKYGGPCTVVPDGWYYVYGSAVEEYAENAVMLESIGLTPELQDRAQWVLHYDEINVKIDLIRYAPNGVSAKSTSSDVLLSYRFYTDEEDAAILEALRNKEQGIQDDL